jgi:hypothetical protein
MAKRNPGTPHRYIEGNSERTHQQIETYLGKKALHDTWEKCASSNHQIKNHAYLLKLRAKIRNVKAYIDHRAGPDADLE